MIVHTLYIYIGVEVLEGLIVPLRLEVSVSEEFAELFALWVLGCRPQNGIFPL